MSNKTIGKFYEKRGEDYFTVVTSPDGDVVLVTQRDSLSLTYPSINLFAESVPQMVALLQKAAGIKAVAPAKVEYEYGIQRTALREGETYIVGDSWSAREEVNESLLSLTTDRYKYTLVKRAKAGKVEVA